MLAVMVTALLLTGCSAGGTAAQTAAVPPANPAQASASRTYLNGNGHDLIDLNDLAGKVAGRSTPSACRADEKSLVRLTQGDSGAGVADPGLAELFGDEFSALSSVLGQCTHGDVPASALSTLSSVHTLVDQRLRADKVHA